MLRRFTGLSIVLACALTGLGVVISSARQAADAVQGSAAVRQSLRNLPLSFVENRGQVDRSVSYYLRGQEASTYFSSSGVTYSLSPRALDAASAAGVARPAARSSAGWAVRQQFLGARTAAPQGEDLAPGHVSYFKGAAAQWATGLPTFFRVKYSSLWPGIDLVYSGATGQLQYDITVRPGADPSAVRLAYRGASGLRVAASGGLTIETPAGSFAEDAPVAYQMIGGRKVQVDASFSLGGPAAPLSYGFRLGSYDATRPLVIDPTVVVFAGYIGGSDDEEGLGVAVDPSGYVYVSGQTGSTEATFPATVGPDLTYYSNTDAFICKVTPGGNNLVYCGYIGGNGWDRSRAVAADADGNAYVVGHTKSSTSTFPVTVGPDITQNGNVDGFICKVNAQGTSLFYCGYIGGNLHDEAKAVTLDAAGDAYVTGGTSSPESTFPVMGGPDLTQNGLSDAFIAEVNPQGSGLVFCGYIGGSSEDHGRGVGLDIQGNVFVDGDAASSQATFPVVGGLDPTYNGAGDAFITKLDPTGQNILYSGYIGGSKFDEARGLAVDPAGHAFVAGPTESPDFPATVGPDLTFNGVQDAFIARVNNSGGSLTYAGFIGGSGGESGWSVAIDRDDQAYVVGQTQSRDFPAVEGPDLTSNGSYDTFITKVDASGTALVYSGYIGGSGRDLGRRVAVDAAGDAYIVGYTTSSNFPTVGTLDASYNGKEDAFVAKVSGP